MYIMPGNPNLSNNPAAGLTPVDFASPPELSPNPAGIPLPQPTMNAPLSVVAPPRKLANTYGIADAPPLLPSGAPALPVAYPNTLPNAAPPAPGTPWLDQQPILGVPNKYLLGGVLAIFLIAQASKKGAHR